MFVLQPPNEMEGDALSYWNVYISNGGLYRHALGSR